MDEGIEPGFPHQLTFQAYIEGDTDIEQVVLEYGVEKRTCGVVTAKAFPEYAPGKRTRVRWTWDMRKSGSEPPGAKLWYRWYAKDKAGNVATSERKTATWLDKKHAWKSLSRGRLILHWNTLDEAFAADLLDSATQSLDRLTKTTGIIPEQPIELFIYSDVSALQSAVLYAPGWTGGMAFPDYNSLVLGIGPEQAVWGKRALAHELTHVLIGSLSSRCLDNIPTWLNEGIAVYSEGELEATSQIELATAIRDNNLGSIYSLSGSFSEEPAQASLAYVQSYSVVNYLIVTYGEEKLLSLFKRFAEGRTTEEALHTACGFGLAELESRWRQSIGAAQQVTPTVSASPSPIAVPTYPPANFSTMPHESRAQTNSGLGLLLIVVCIGLVGAIYLFRRKAHGT